MAEPEVKAPSAKGDVKIFGAHLNKKTLYIGLAVGAGVLGYAWYSKRKNAGAGGALVDSSASGADNIDPSTGFPYGSAEDTAALAQDSGVNTNLTGASTPTPA